MKNILIVSAFFLITSLISMNLDRPNSLLTVFGISERLLNQCPIELQQCIATKVFPQMWYPYMQLENEKKPDQKRRKNRIGPI